MSSFFAPFLSGGATQFLVMVFGFLVVLTVLVFVHELGHYLIARRNGVRIEIFSIGFGPELFGWNDRAGTRWKVSALPLGGHHIGTARMSESPSSGVVNSDGRVHFVNNLYVAGCATFPTSGHANPILTIVAMALRLAQHLEMRLGNRLV